MADASDTGTQGADYKAHEQSWNGFKAMMTWGTLGAFLVGAIVVLLIAPK
ncbi:aa3-type cytochrome c oxidase subunit IV [Sphingomonas sp.]|nr:aa3-type cytochrome c oxidase subunit IV [Sphingomonas sp.]MBO9715055.1 aa3-type cytochrome c oxidase subunit IV [Sphingomonas sp.]